MRLWLDAQLSPYLASWIEGNFKIETRAVRDLGLRDAVDSVIFQKARDADAVVITKDRDFVELLLRHGSPPKVLWLTCGNTSNPALRTILAQRLPVAVQMLKTGETLVEIRD